MAAHLHSLSDILNRKKTFSDVPKTIFWLKTRFKMIYFLLDKVIRYTQILLIAYGLSKLVTLGYM